MIKKIKSDILASIKNKKINVFFLFLFLAFIILIFTKLSKTTTNTIVFNIEKINVPQENIIFNDSIALNITLKTHGFKWLSYYFSEPKIIIDFKKDVYKKDSVFIWNKSKAYLENTQFDKKVELLNVSPDVLTFRYGVNMVKKVPVKLNSDIKYNPGFDVSKPYVLIPDSVVVVGPKALVSKVDFIQTEKVLLVNVKKDISETVKLKLPKTNKDLTFSNDKVLLKATVEKFTEGTLKVPVTIINVPNNINLKYFPKEVNVSYYVSLSNFNSISAKDFNVICNYSNAVNNQSILVPELEKFPETAKNVKIKQQRIEFIIIE
ncbi:YbbR-like domain-containing protein [Mariniflexile litorale]|uniref:YbbR-like domain-containing protein n=1 Tax=Mariniflexile litorale TaxID=3045158 RepID=A0AAU7EFR4_9FLAO|nr:YbbR-like domain-containing protein [Mariniflexile sp. KMM 9835]MDQ8211690.1 YbbR-like domain-containing protein [Mariniflexile sp. KMM 9835]